MNDGIASPPSTQFRVASVQMISGMQVDANLQQAAQLIGQAAAQGAQLVVLPEYFCLLGKTDHDKVAIREPDGDGPLQRWLADQARQHQVCLIGGTVPLGCDDPGRVLNTTLVYGPDGQRVARYDKIHLFGFQKGSERYDESATIQAGTQPVRFELPAPSQPEARFGDGGDRGLRVALSICYDLRFPELYRALSPADSPVDLIVVPAAFTHTTGQAHWEILLRARAIENQCYVLACGQGGKHENGRRTWGQSMLIDPWGRIMNQLAEGPGAVVADIDPMVLREVRLNLPALRHRVLG